MKFFTLSDLICFSDPKCICSIDEVNRRFGFIVTQVCSNIKDSQEDPVKQATQEGIYQGLYKIWYTSLVLLPWPKKV